MNANELNALATEINGRNRNRTLTLGDVAKFAELLETNRDNAKVTSIRVYSNQGFVPNSYKHRANIAALNATRNEAGEFVVSGGWFDAHRSHGNGALVTINGRAA